MTPPALAVMRGIEKPVHEALVSSRSLVCEERGDLFGNRWQADEIEADSPDESSPRGWR